MKICVLQPDYSTSAVDYQYYDPPRNLAHLMPGAIVDHVFLNKLTTYKQLKDLSRKGYDIFVNLCEGYLEWEVPSIDVIQTLELLNLPYTGPPSHLYDPSKELMKYVAFSSGMRSPAYAIVEKTEDVDAVCAQLSFPLFVKPAKAGDSLGIDQQSLVWDKQALIEKVSAILPEYPELLVESYIDGREFTVLVAAQDGSGKQIKVFTPVEFIFPAGNTFKTYALKTSDLHTDANIPVREEALRDRLQEAARAIFCNFGGIGYARMDFRMDSLGDLYFLEINFTCSVFYKDGYEGSADYILKNDAAGQAGFLQLIIAEGIDRHRRKQKTYVVKGNAIVGYGVYAARDLAQGSVVFAGEACMQRIVSKTYIQENWSPADQETFWRYAYPISEEVYVLWSDNPCDWAPQNHSCDPNTGFKGLDVIALRAIPAGEELTLDYGAYSNEWMIPFDCRCGAANCRGRIEGRSGNTIMTKK